jgi:hypothetical protein
MMSLPSELWVNVTEPGGVTYRHTDTSQVRDARDHFLFGADATPTLP